MNTAPRLPHARVVLLPVVIIFLAWAAAATAAPFHQPTIDGTITPDGVDWDPADRVVDDSHDDTHPNANVKHVWCTWDQDSLYVAVTYQDISTSYTLAVYMDLDRGVGPNDGSMLAHNAGNFLMPAGHRFELVLGRSTLDGLNGPPPASYLVTGDDGSMSILEGRVNAHQTSIQLGNVEDKARFPVWSNAEFALPWSVIYPGLGGGVPDNAVIKMAAVATVASADSNGIDSAPDNDGIDGGPGQVLLGNLSPSVIDITGDGVPDPANATISGTVTLPNNSGNETITVTAELLDFAGRDPGAPLSVAVLDPNVFEWTLARLPAGRYLITTSARGYFDDTVEVVVTEGQVITGTDQTLREATAIGGNITFATRDGGPGTVTLKSSDGTVLDVVDFTPVSGSFAYTFFREAGGDYIVAVEAETYLPAETAVTVVTGENQTNVDFNLISQTMVSGTVSFLELVDGKGQAGTIYFRDGEGNELASSGFPNVGTTAFEFFTPVGGTFLLTANTNTVDIVGRYAPVQIPVDVVAGQDVTDIAIELILAAYVTGTLSFEGPAAATHTQFIDTRTGFAFPADTLYAAGDTVSNYLGPGEYRLEMEAAGYVPRSLVFNVSEEDTSLGALPLIAVRATHLEIINDDGEILPEALATYYDPANGDPWTSTRVLLAARDDAGRDDLYDLDGRLTNFKLTARKMDDLSAPTGTPVFYRTELEADIDSVTSFENGRAKFWMSDTVVEVLRVYLAQPNKAPIAGRIVVAFQDPRPKTVVLNSWRQVPGTNPPEYVPADTLTADNSDRLHISAKLYDSAGNESLLPGIPVAFVVTNSSSGAGKFEEQTVFTNADGLARSPITATGAGVLRISSSVVIGNRVLDVRAFDLDSGETELPLTVIPGPTAGWDLGLPGTMGNLAAPIRVSAQTIDEFGNPTPDPGQTINFSVIPAGLGTFDPASALSNAEGRAVSTFTPSGQAGLVEILGDSPIFQGDAAGYQLRDIIVIPDPIYYDEPADRQTFDKTDLTALIVDNTPDELLLEIPFQSDFGGMQIHIAMETEFDAAGATSDPFEQPVNFGHALLPDYVLSSKYSGNDYGDLRRASGSGWDYWDPNLKEWVPLDPNNYQGQGDIQSLWVTKSSSGLSIRIPKDPFGASLPDSMLLEAYLTQDTDGVKRSAFDSAPQDSTLNLDFDYENPGEDDWDVALGPVTLEAWGPTFVTRTDFPVPPTVDNVRATPEVLDAGQSIVLEALVSEGVDDQGNPSGDGIGDVVADLSAMGGSALTRMYDDGNSSHGDAVAGDGVYSLFTIVPISNPGGSQDLYVNAYDGSNILATQGSTTIDVTALITPIIQATDAVGDDHGPNQAGTQKKFYTYPTNIAFVEGAFDLTGLTVFETKANVGGELVDMIAFQVSMGDFPDPKDPGTADWSPLYADLNITKIDILIDSGAGGSISSLPWRQAAFQPWDAWDYAIIIDGWYKALIPSLGQNTVDSWRDNALRNDQDILLISDPDLDTVTALISASALGDPTPEDIAKWDIAVCMASHDFGGEEVLGGIRWVEEARSEWQFGGGQSGDRDSNYMDLLLIPGAGHSAGAPQDSILDYESEQALARMELNQTPVAIEMSRFEDTGPPVIDTGGDGSVVTKVAPIVDAPLAMAVKITDDFRVDRAVFRYRSTGFQGDGWDREVPMGYLGQDTWIVDILPSWLDSNLVYSPIDSTRYLEFEVEAADPLDKFSISPVTTLQIEKNAFCRPQDRDLDDENLVLLQVDGSVLNIPDKLRTGLVRNHFAEAWTGGEVDPDTLEGPVQLQWDLCNIEDVIQHAPVVPEGKPIGVFRQVFLATSDSLGGYLDYEERLPGTAQLSLHYPQDWIPDGLDENLIALYLYNAESNRWVMVGGNVTPTGNNVTATVNQTGTYGLFATEANGYNSDEVISGITISPNPFSPNGDGLYDETAISFFLSEEATVTVEIYNVYGDRKNILAQTFPFSGSDITDPVPRRVPGLIWNGTDFSGDKVPYGIYILRILVTYNFGSGTRTIRSSHPVAVIR